MGHGKEDWGSGSDVSPWPWSMSEPTGRQPSYALVAELGASGSLLHLSDIQFTLLNP